VLERATGKVADLTENMDRWVESFAWSPDSASLFFTAEDRGRQSIQFKSVKGGEARIAVSGDNHLDDMQFTPDGKTLIYTQQSGTQPAGFTARPPRGGAAVALTHINDAVLSAHEMTPLEEFWVDGAEARACRASW
jgi:Tol biopolymer transport system component